MNRSLIALPLVLCATTPALAGPFVAPAEIDTAVVRFTGMPTGSPGGAAQGVDPRLRLATCNAPRALGWDGARRDAVLVQCPDSPGWRIFVPVLVTQAVGQAPAILRGEAVTIVLSGEGFTVTQPGEALEGGAVGAWIRVKSASSAADPLRARIVRPGLVRLDLATGGSDLP